MPTANTMTMGTNFPAELSTEIFSKVRGKSSLAKLSNQIPVSFTGTDIFTFNFDNEISVVGENGEKVAGGATVAPVSIKPVKVEYGARVTDEFMYASEERQLEILAEFQEAFARKLAKGLDIMGLHGYNPYSGTASAVIGTNHLDAKATAVTSATSIEAGMETAAATVTNYDLNGVILSKAAGAELGQLKENGVSVYPQFKWGGQVDEINGLSADVNVTADTSAPVAYTGDFDAFKWGYAKDIFFKVIEYGDPDNTGVDLAGSNQVYLRGEAYIGWGIMDGAAFAKVTE
jgi:HK97 family phage major capsid protein